jgi:hypothetical protein
VETMLARVLSEAGDRWLLSSNVVEVKRRVEAGNGSVVDVVKIVVQKETKILV